MFAFLPGVGAAAPWGTLSPIHVWGRRFYDELFARGVSEDTIRIRNERRGSSLLTRVVVDQVRDIDIYIFDHKLREVESGRDRSNLKG